MSEATDLNLGELIRRQLALRKAMAHNPRYRPDAYLFVCEGVNYTCERLGGRRDVTGRELTEGLCDLAVEQYGYLAPTVLKHWGISSTEDFGEIVFTLVEHGLLGKNARDSKADFKDIFDLHTTLRERYRIDGSLD
jgi:uncharacterized repeat protein (TIGR04138 family)